MFPPKKKPRKQTNVVFIQPKESWTHDFCLLSDKSARKTPSSSMLLGLREAGLGKRKITFDDKRSSHGKLRQVLETIYPKLKSQHGAFELLRADRGGINSSLALINMSPHGYTIPYLKEQVSGTTMIYIRPIQSDLPLTKVVTKTDDSIKSSCKNCSREVPLATMRSHMEECMQGESTFSGRERPICNELSSDDDVDEEVLITAAEESEAKFSEANAIEKISTASNLLKETSQLRKELGTLFPHHSSARLDLAVIGCSSLEEAANNMLEEDKDDEVDKEGEKYNFPVFSSSNSSLKTRPKVGLDTLLKEFSIFNAKSGFDEVKVDRDSFWADLLKFYKRKLNDVAALGRAFEVTFENEDGLDGGSVKVEFFNMAWEHVTKRLFEGNIKRLVPVKDTTKLFLFRLCGMMVVHTVMQGGPIQKLPQLAPPIISCLLGESTDEIYSELNKHDIPLTAATENAHYLIEELDLAVNDKSVKEVFTSEERGEAYWQIVNASHWPAHETINNANKSLFIQEIMYNELIRSRYELIKEVKQGMESMGFYTFMKKHPTQFKELFIAKDEIFGPEEFKALLQEVSPKDFAQQQAYDWFLEFIDDGAKQVAADDEESRLKALLAFTTGWQTPNTYGAPIRIKIEFLRDDDSQSLPTSSACLSIIRIPTVHSTKKKFEASIIAAIKHARRGFPNP